MASIGGVKAQERRTKIREALWPGEQPWGFKKEKGFFFAPRTLPLLLRLLRLKKISGDKDPGPVYVELLSRHMGDGLIEMDHEAEHAYAAGYTAVRAWRERMKILEDAGFIKSQGKTNRPYTYVLLLHPAGAVAGLQQKGLVPEEWQGVYDARRAVTKESELTSAIPLAGVPGAS